jgi:hypothetical protein
MRSVARRGQAVGRATGGGGGAETVERGRRCKVDAQSVANLRGLAPGSRGSGVDVPARDAARAKAAVGRGDGGRDEPAARSGDRRPGNRRRSGPRHLSLRDFAAKARSAAPAARAARPFCGPLSPRVSLGRSELTPARRRHGTALTSSLPFFRSLRARADELQLPRMFAQTCVELQQLRPCLTAHFLNPCLPARGNSLRTARERMRSSGTGSARSSRPRGAAGSQPTRLEHDGAPR